VYLPNEWRKQEFEPILCPQIFWEPCERLLAMFELFKTAVQPIIELGLLLYSLDQHYEEEAVHLEP